MDTAIAFDLLTREDEPTRCARSLLLWNLWDVHPTVSCEGSTAGDGNRLGDLGLGRFVRAHGRAKFTRNEQGAEMAERLRAMGYRADGRRYG